MKRRESQAHDMTLGSNISGDAKDAAGADGHRAKALPHRKHRRFSRRSQQPQCWSVAESRFHDGSRVLGSGRDAQVGCRRRHALLDPGADAADPDDGMTCCTDSPKHFHSGGRRRQPGCAWGLQSGHQIVLLRSFYCCSSFSRSSLFACTIIPIHSCSSLKRSTDKATQREREREGECILFHVSCIRSAVSGRSCILSCSSAGEGSRGKQSQRFRCQSCVSRLCV